MSALAFLKPLPIKQKIRLGNKYDGGYVVYKKALDQTDVLMTYGVGWEVSFEEHFNRLTGKEVYMFDPFMFGKYMVDFKHLKKHLAKVRVKATIHYLRFMWKAWQKRKALEKKKIYFINEGISSRKSGKLDTLDGHLQKLQLTGKQVLLKIDIEGHEYNIFGDAGIYQSLQNVNQLILEIHDLKNHLRHAQQVLQKLSADYDIIHVHGNNCGGTFVLYDQSGAGQDVILPDTLEITLVKRDVIDPADMLSESMVYPVSGLDFPNDPRRKDLPLVFI